MINSVLVVHRNPQEARHIEAALKQAGKVQVTAIHSGMEAIAAFSQCDPDLVLLDAGLSDLPAVHLVRVFLEMSPGLLIWFVTTKLDDQIQRLAQKHGALGALAYPLDHAAELLVPPPAMQLAERQENTEDETINENVHGAWDRVARQPGYSLEMDASAVNPTGFSHKGHLHIRGDLRNVALLEVSGELRIEGNVINSGIRAGTFLDVKGRIVACSDKGVFCHGMIDTIGIEDSLVACGRNLYIKDGCRHSRVSVIQSLIGRTPKTYLTGGRTQVGEYLDIGVLGDQEHTQTAVELGPARFRKAWMKARYRLWKIALARHPELRQQRTRFETELRDPNFYLRQARCHTLKMYPGILMRIGDVEDYLFQPRTHSVRIKLGRKYGKLGIIVVDRDQKSSSWGPMKVVVSKSDP